MERAHGRRILSNSAVPLDWDLNFHVGRKAIASRQRSIYAAGRQRSDLPWTEDGSWCPRLGTVLSDVEVEHQKSAPDRAAWETEPVEVGVIETFAYPLDGKPSEDAESFAWSRWRRRDLKRCLETSLSQYTQTVLGLHLARSGRSVVHPFWRQLPIIADAALVDLDWAPLKRTRTRPCRLRRASGTAVVPLLDDGAILASHWKAPTIMGAPSH